MHLWRTTSLANTSNYNIAAIVISIMGLFFVSLPRYYVALVWREVNDARLQRYGNMDLIGHTDDGVQLAINAADSIFAVILFRYVVVFAVHVR
jgi:hypothetical protein